MNVVEKNNKTVLRVNQGMKVGYINDVILRGVILCLPTYYNSVFSIKMAVKTTLLLKT